MNLHYSLQEFEVKLVLELRFTFSAYALTAVFDFLEDMHGAVHNVLLQARDALIKSLEVHVKPLLVNILGWPGQDRSALRIDV